MAGSSYGTRVRGTPIEYTYHDGALYLLGEGGCKFANLPLNPPVSVAVYDIYEGISRLGGMQLAGKADLIESSSEEYAYILTLKGLNLDKTRGLPFALHMINVTLWDAEFLWSGFGSLGYDAKQIYCFDRAAVSSPDKPSRMMSMRVATLLNAKGPFAHHHPSSNRDDGHSSVPTEPDTLSGLSELAQTRSSGRDPDPAPLRHLAALLFDLGDTLMIEESEVKDAEGTTLRADLVPGVAPALHAFQAQGYPLALVADSRPNTPLNVLRQHRLLDLFDCLAISEVVGVSKPDPRIFCVALDALGIAQADYCRVVMVGNNLERDIVGANRLGLISVHFCWSDRRRWQPLNDDERPRFTVSCASELVSLIERLESKNLENTPVSAT